jgi:hypothetical protein
MATTESASVSASRMLLTAMLLRELLRCTSKYQILYLPLWIEGVWCGLGLAAAVQGP